MTSLATRHLDYLDNVARRRVQTKNILAKTNQGVKLRYKYYLYQTEPNKRMHKIGQIYQVYLKEK